MKSSRNRTTRATLAKAAARDVELGKRLRAVWEIYERKHGPLSVEEAARRVREDSSSPLSARLLRQWKQGSRYPTRQYEQLESLATLLDVGVGWLVYGGNENVMPGVPVPLPLYAKGVHVAPFFSASGELMILSIGKENVLRHMAEVGPPDEQTMEAIADGPNEACSGNADLIQHSCGARTFYPPGFHRAPWRSADNPKEGVTLLVIGADHRLIASMDAANLVLARSAMRELEAVYRDSMPYSDGYAQSDDDSSEDFGDEWKG